MSKLLTITKLAESICCRPLSQFLVGVSPIAQIRISNYSFSTAIKIVLSSLVVYKLSLRKDRLAIVFKIIVLFLLLFVRFRVHFHRVVLNEILNLGSKNSSHLEHTLIDGSQVVLFADLMHIFQDFDQLLVTLLSVKIHYWNPVAQMFSEREHCIVH